MRIFLFILLLFPFFLSAEPGKVVGVIPVKFGSKGMHAPVPYSQQIMQRGWTRVPTVNLPLSNPSGKNPRYQPTKMTKRSIARSLGYLAGRAGNLTPATKAMLIGYGAYEANCVTQNYPSLCFDGPEEVGTECALGEVYQDIGCAVSAPSTRLWRADVSHGSVRQVFSRKDLKDAQKMACNWFLQASAKDTNSSFRECTGGRGFKYKECNWVVKDGKTVCDFTGSWKYGNANGSDWQADSTEYYCPPDDPRYEEFSVLRGKGNQSKCTKDFDKRKPKTPLDADWIEDKINENPRPLDDIGLDDFVDWETGKPRPDAFENPTVDRVSDAFADAAEAVATGTVQHTNPNGKGYVPAEMMPNLIVQINNWHEGNTFTDIFDNRQVTPETPPAEESKIDWDKFPGITKKQYEASNDTWGNAAVNGKPTIETELEKLTEEQQKLNDFINEPTPDLPYEIDFPALFQLPTTGQCRGFTVTGSIRGVASPIVVDKHCPPYEAWGRPVIEWFLGIMTIFQCFHIFRRTIEVA
jgi:hypothetical protein